MRVTVIGTGYVGLVTGAGLAQTGNRVTCVDHDSAKIETLRGGKIPFYEPGLDGLVQNAIAQKCLSFTSDLAASVAQAEVVFLTVGTPAQDDGAPDLSQVFAAAKEVASALAQFTLVVTKSTVPVGTSARINELMKGHTDVPFAVASNPEFLKEGDAVNDFLKPDRIVIGTANERARAVLEELYAPFIIRERRAFFMDIESAELTKYVANALLATKISFINEVAGLCEKLGTDVESIRRAVGADTRIGSAFLYPGMGFGGSCFPKDLAALIATGQKAQRPLRILEAVTAVNTKQPAMYTDRIFEHLGKDLTGKTVAIWGLSFKPRTDDVREAPALRLIQTLRDAGAAVRAYDPVANDNAKHALNDEAVIYTTDPYEAAQGAHALCVCTEWPIFRQPDFEQLKTVMAAAAIFDGRNIYDPIRVREHGFYYYGAGRP